jgi:hypothetical protein
VNAAQPKRRPSLATASQHDRRREARVLDDDVVLLLAEPARQDPRIVVLERDGDRGDVEVASLRVGDAHCGRHARPHHEAQVARAPGDPGIRRRVAAFVPAADPHVARRVDGRCSSNVPTTSRPCKLAVRGPVHLAPHVAGL